MIQHLGGNHCLKDIRLFRRTRHISEALITDGISSLGFSGRIMCVRQRGSVMELIARSFSPNRADTLCRPRMERNSVRFLLSAIWDRPHGLAQAACKKKFSPCRGPPPRYFLFLRSGTKIALD